jgi:hypothetical protein
MAKKDAAQTLLDVQDHYLAWEDDNEKRRKRENGWDDIIDAYNNVLPENWPYLARVVDPCIRTTLIEKKARLTNGKLRGRLVPREGADTLKARLNNALLDYQWDSANKGGSMNAKFGTMDIDTRLLGSKFSLVTWVYEEEDGKVIKNGNEMTPLDLNDCGIDPACTHIRSAKWFQHREYITIDDLDESNNIPGLSKWPGLDELKEKIAKSTQNRRDANFTSRQLQIKGLEDRVGTDKSFPVVEIVTEYRPERFITFSPKYNVILRDIPNPYKHKSIPVIQLRYYELEHDPIGESEVESVLPIWRAIQATLCGFIDSMNLHMNPPLKIVEGQVRMETIQWGPQANWIVNSPTAITEHAGSGEPLQFFQSAYTSLKAAFNQAMGDMSQGVSAVDPFNQDKTATEIKQMSKQQNARDENNQLYLAECITDMMRMWQSNNQQFLFANPDMSEYILRIVGQDMFNYFKRAGLDEMEVPDESILAISDMVGMQDGNVSDEQLQQMIGAAGVPKFPVVENPTAKKSEQRLKPKMTINEQGDSAEISLIPEDLEGTYDYVPDVKSMAMSAHDELLSAQNKALEMMVNPQIMQVLQQNGVTTNVKDLIQTILENTGLRDAERYFNTAQTPTGAPANMGQPGLPTPSAALPPGAEQMAGSPDISGQPGVPMGVPGELGQGAGVPGASAPPLIG